VAPLAAGAIGLLEGWILLGTTVVGAIVGTCAGRAIASDTCSECRAPLPRGAERCARCKGTIVNSPPGSELEEEELSDAVRDLDDRGERVSDFEPALQLLCAMYAAWAIERRHLLPDLEEQHAELMVAVHCGNYPTRELSRAWESIGNGLNEEAAEFFRHYCAGHERLGSQDYERLAGAGGLVDSRGGYGRVLDLLDSRLWTR
jgi:hypothetical protein